MSIEGKLKRIIQDYDGVNHSLCLVELDTIREALQALQEKNGSEYSETPLDSLWISVKDRLPVISTSTLICTNRDAICTAHFWPKSGTWASYAGKNARYWMPLPNPPDRGDR